MVKEQFSEQLQAYNRWKEKVAAQIEAYRKWVADHSMSSPEDDLRMFETIEALKTDNITIAVAAEFSRGKTELINSIFFADYSRRLLPSSAGRTTMCPTELFFDTGADKPYIRMLPIETRLEEMSIAEYKQNADYWTSIELDVENPDAMVDAFLEIKRTKPVTLKRAIQMGLYSEDQDKHKEVAPESIEIPMWRHALISFPHPLLEQGLVILDTPGLNALGSEPELTMDMLPKAQAVIFILSADTGATKSDMDIWQQHAKVYRDSKQTGVIVVLNKIDTLWDELEGDNGAASIAKQCKETATLLGIKSEDVYPVSAQKGLLAKIKKDDTLLERSGLPKLEHTLSHDILPTKREIVRANIVTKIGGMVESTRNVLRDRFEGNKKQLAEMRALSGQSADKLMAAMKTLRAEQAVYQKDVENFQTSRHVLKRQLSALNEALALQALDHLIAKTRESMVDSWTTGGMKKGMKTFFEGAKETMVQVNWQVDKANKIVDSIYERFREEHGFRDLKPELFSTNKFQRELTQLYQRADEFRNSPVTTLTEQSFVVKKFFVNMVSHARNIFFKANEDAERWAKSAMGPLGARIKERKHQLEARLNNLRKAKESREKLAENIQTLEAESIELAEQLKTISKILEAIKAPVEEQQQEQPILKSVDNEQRDSSNIATG